MGKQQEYITVDSVAQAEKETSKAQTEGSTASAKYPVEELQTFDKDNNPIPLGVMINEEEPAQ